MTGESLLNNTYDVIGKGLAQGAAGSVDSLLKPGILELLAAIGIIILTIYLLNEAKGRRKWLF